MDWCQINDSSHTYCIKSLPALPGLGKNGKGKNILNCQEAQNSQKG